MRVSQSLRQLAFISSAALLCGCSGTLDQEDAAAGKDIGASGGFVTSADGVFTVVFPPGALTQPTVVSIAATAEAPESLGTAYSVQGPTSLEVPVLAEYRYTLAQVQGRDVQDLNIGASAGAGWDRLMRVSLDENTQTVAAEVPALAGAYGLIEGAGGSGTDTDTDDSDT